MNDIAINLAEQINQTFDESVTLASSVKEATTTAVQKALECGQLMLQQKEALQKTSGKDRCGWLDWLAANCPKISEQTARRYMSLAKRSHVSGYLEDISSLRQAYLATGIIKEQPKPKDNTPDPQKPWVKYVRFLDGFRLWYNKRVEQSPMESWPENARRVLKNELKWFAQLYEQL